MYFSSRQSQISLSDVAWIWEKFKRPAALNAQTFLKWNGNIDSIRSTEMVTFYCKRWMGATLHEKIYLIGFYSKYTTTNDVCTHIAGVSLFWFIKPTFVTSETENLYTLYTIDKNLSELEVLYISTGSGTFQLAVLLGNWQLENWRIQTRHGLKRHGRLLQDQSKYLLCLLN